MRQMIPELSSNNEFNLPSLSTFVGFIPKVPNIGVYAFAFSLAEELIMQLNEEQDKIINESFWLEWQNTKRQGLDKVLRFIDNNDWAEKNGFEYIYLSQEILQLFFKGKFKTFESLRNTSLENEDEKKCVVISHR